MMKKITVTAEQLPVANLSVSSIGRVIRTPSGAVGRLVAFSAASSEIIRVMLMNPEEVFIPEDQFLMTKAEGFYLDADKYLTYCTETDVIEVTAGELHAGHVGLKCLSLTGRTNGNDFPNQYRTVNAVRHGVRKGEAVIDFGGISGAARVNNDAVLTLLQP